LTEIIPFGIISANMKTPAAQPDRACALPEEFRHFQEKVRAAGVCRPDMPVQLVLLSRLLGYVATRMEESFDRVLGPWGLTDGSWLVLVVVYARAGEEVTPTDLSRSLFLARANVTRVTDELVRRGLLHREPSTRDRRVLKLSLTPAGTALVQEAMPQAWQMHRATWSALDPAQLAEAQTLLCGIAAGIEAAGARHSGNEIREMP
jgi:DNA-binding MarR family transcriptional regulator